MIERMICMMIKIDMMDKIVFDRMTLVFDRMRVMMDNMMTLVLGS